MNCVVLQANSVVNPRKRHGQPGVAQSAQLGGGCGRCRPEANSFLHRRGVAWAKREPDKVRAGHLAAGLNADRHHESRAVGFGAIPMVGGR